MSKRMTDTGKWDKKWFRELPTAYKLFWQFILDRCDLAGFWDIDFKAATFFIGSPIKRDKAIVYFKDQIYEVAGKYWLVLDFIKFQNGWPLNNSSPVHKKITEILNTKGIDIKDNTLYDRVVDRVCYTQLVIVKVDGGEGGNKSTNPLKDLGWNKSESQYQGLNKSYPKLFLFTDPLTFEQHQKLLTKYNPKDVEIIYNEMQNYKDLLKKSESAYLTATNWLNRKKK